MFFFSSFLSFFVYSCFICVSFSFLFITIVDGLPACLPACLLACPSFRKTKKQNQTREWEGESEREKERVRCGERERKRDREKERVSETHTFNSRRNVPSKWNGNYDKYTLQCCLQYILVEATRNAHQMLFVCVSVWYRSFYRYLTANECVLVWRSRTNWKYNGKSALSAPSSIKWMMEIICFLARCLDSIKNATKLSKCIPNESNALIFVISCCGQCKWTRKKKKTNEIKNVNCIHCGNAVKTDEQTCTIWTLSSNFSFAALCCCVGRQIPHRQLFKRNIHIHTLFFYIVYHFWHISATFTCFPFFFFFQFCWFVYNIIIWRRNTEPSPSSIQLLFRCRL